MVQRAPVRSKRCSKLSHEKLVGRLAGRIAHCHLLLWSIVAAGVALGKGSSTLWVSLRPLRGPLMGGVLSLVGCHVWAADAASHATEPALQLHLRSIGFFSR